MTRLALAAALLAAAPAFAQATTDVPPAVDTRLVGEWSLVEVNDLGEMGRYGAELEGMVCSFSSTGEAEVRIEVLQDSDTHASTKTFEFETADGKIMPEDAPAVSYAVLSKDLLELRDASGLVVRLARAGRAQ